MKHKIGFNPLNRKAAHRLALHRNMVTSLFRHERIKTTKAKAKAARRTAEKLISRARIDSVHNRRQAARLLWDQAILNRLFTEIGPRFRGRPGGYTRILKLGFRPGDAAEIVLLELVEKSLKKEETQPEKKKAKVKKEDKATEGISGEKKKSAETKNLKEGLESPKEDPLEIESKAERTEEKDTGKEKDEKA